VYILLFNSCVKFQAKISCSAEISQKSQGRLFYVHAVGKGKEVYTTTQCDPSVQTVKPSGVLVYKADCGLLFTRLCHPVLFKYIRKQDCLLI